jgi:hypothetical protein
VNDNESNTVVFLSDGDTWDTVLGCTVAVLTSAGIDHIQCGMPIDTLEPGTIVSEITVKDLIRFWNDNH